MPQKGSKRRKRLMAPNVVHKSEEEYERTLTEVQHLHNCGYNNTHIQAELKRKFGIRVSLAQVGVYIKKIIDRWKEHQLFDRKVYVQQKLAQYEHMRREAWEAYYASKKCDKSMTKEFAVPLRLKMKKISPDEEDELDKKRKPKEGTPQHDLVLVKKVLKQSTKLPASQYLQIIALCLEAERELLGLDAPKQADVKVSSGDKPTMNWDEFLATREKLKTVEDEIAEVHALMSGKGDVIDAEVVDKEND